MSGVFQGGRRRFRLLLVALAVAAAGTAVSPELTPPARAAELPPDAKLYDDIAHSEGGARAYTAVGGWDHTMITYWVGNITRDMPAHQAKAAIAEAFALWSAQSNLTFAETLDPAQADIWIEWKTGNHGDGGSGNTFDGVDGILGHAFFPPVGVVHFDDAEAWTVAPRGSGAQPIDLVTIAAHEFGHALGLDHSSDTAALMYPWYVGSHRYLTADDVAGIRSLYPAPQTVPSRFAPVTPARLLDTRSGQGARQGPVTGGTHVPLQVRGAGGVPASATAAVLNVTAVSPTHQSYVTVFPSGVPRSWASNLNVTPGLTVANLVTVQLGSDGNVGLFNAVGSLHLVADVVGYYAADDSKGGYGRVDPTRLLDTREEPGATLGPSDSVNVVVAGSGTPVPADATAVLVNVTATGATRDTYITAYPAGGTRPYASNLNPAPGRTIPNLVSVGVGASRSITLYNAAGSVDLIADVVGYYRAGIGDRFVGVTPYRLYDSRVTGQPLVGGVSRAIQAGGQGPVASGATGVVMNTTVTEPTAASHLTVYPSAVTLPLASNLNFVAGQTVPNLVVTALSSGTFRAYNSVGSVHVVFDVNGYFVGA